MHNTQGLILRSISKNYTMESPSSYLLHEQCSHLCKIIMYEVNRGHSPGGGK